MLYITRKNLKNICFSDRVIENMNVDFEKKTILISVDGAFLKINNKLTNLNAGKIEITMWKNLYISIFSSEEKNWFLMDSNNFDTLKEICEINYNENLIFSGFGKNTGQWLEYKFEGSDIKISFNEEKFLS